MKRGPASIEEYVARVVVVEQRTADKRARAVEEVYEYSRNNRLNVGFCDVCRLPETRRNLQMCHNYFCQRLYCMRPDVCSSSNSRVVRKCESVSLCSGTSIITCSESCVPKCNDCGRVVCRTCCRVCHVCKVYFCAFKCKPCTCVNPE